MRVVESLIPDFLTHSSFSVCPPDLTGSHRLSRWEFVAEDSGFMNTSEVDIGYTVSILTSAEESTEVQLQPALSA